MAFSEASHQQARLIVRHHINKYNLWQVEKHNASRYAGLSYKRSAWWLSGNDPASIHLAEAPASVHVCSTYTRPAVQPSFPQGQQTYLPLSMFDYVAQDQYNWHVGYNCLLTACMSFRVASHQQIYLNQLKLTSKHICSCGGWTSRYICYTCLRPTGMCLWSYPTNGLVNTIAPDIQACMLQLHLTNSHVFILCLLSACMSVTVSSYQHPCILHLHQTINHVCNNSIRPFAMPFTVAPN